MCRLAFALVVSGLVLAVGTRVWAQPDPAFCRVTPCDDLWGIIVCPDAPNPIPGTIVTVNVRNSSNNPIPNVPVSVGFDHPSIRLCETAVLTGFTNANGTVQLRVAGGGCAAGVPDAGRVVAAGTLIRSYENVKSPDWDGTQADLVVDEADSTYFYNCLGGEECPCADYDNDGTVQLSDLIIFTTPRDDRNHCTGTASPRGACCIGETCVVLTQGDCGLHGGTFLGAGTFCTPNPCSIPEPGACCLGETCLSLTADECEAQEGLFLGEGAACTPNPCEFSESCADCGPGPHWIHNPDCPAGYDHMPSGAVVGMDTNLDCIRDMNVVLQGPVRVRRTNPLDDSSNFPGTRPVDGHLDVIDTEILSMSLTGSGVVLTAGSGLGSVPLDPSRGTIAEQPSPIALVADSFFDVFFEVDLGGGNRLYNQSPLRINSVIDCVPPRAIYAHPDVCTPLFTSPVPGQGTHVANLVSANHSPFLDPVTEVEDEAPMPPSVPALLGNVPNPVHSQTTIRFYATGAGSASIEIFDAGGRVMRRLGDTVLSAGPQGIIWDGRDSDGRAAATGIYQYKLRAGTVELTGKLTVVR